MTYEKQIVLRTLKQVQDKIYELIDDNKKKLKNDNSFEDKLIQSYISHFELMDLLLGCVAKENGIKIEVEEDK